MTLSNYHSDVSGISFYTYLPKIMPYFSYTVLHPSTIKMPLSHHKNVRFNPGIHAFIALLFHCLAYSRLGLIRTPEGFWAALPRPVTLFVCADHPSCYRDPESRWKCNSDCWLLTLIFCHNFWLKFYVFSMFWFYTFLSFWFFYCYETVLKMR